MEILKLREHSELASEAAEWFHSKWHIPVEEYTKSIQECLSGGCVPQWYVAVENGQIIGGIGVIENDFHDRKDLTPNVCAVYVEENCWNLFVKICVHLDLQPYPLSQIIQNSMNAMVGNSCAWCKAMVNQI